MKPTIKKGPASQYAAPNERIMEIASREGGKLLGCLISVRRVEGELRIDIYRADEGVTVNGLDLHHQANARLIAAAPDMLEALRAAWSNLVCEADGNDFAVCSDEDGICDSCKASAKAETAIAKAEGTK